MINYGLVWENESETLEDYQVIKDDDLSIIGNKDIDHLLIEGDNLYSLNWLSTRCSEKVDVIYIDPPYNTKNKTFMYNDNFSNKNDTYKHSNWLSFMYNRLKLASGLLKDSGVILISIDDNENAHLKLLCDHIFGENNYVNTFIVKKIVKNANSQFKQVKSLNKAFEYVLVYRRSDKFYFPNAYKDSTEKRKEGYWKDFKRDGYRSTMMYQIDGVKPEHPYRWKWSKDRSDRALENYLLYLKEYSIKYSLKEYWELIKEQYEEETGFKLDFLRNHNQRIQHWVSPSEKTLMDTNLMDYPITDTFGKRKYQFDTVKNLDTISKLIDMVSTKNSIVLDFFAGSGTTAHAVLELNKKDNGNRQFILCTNNENNICREITYKRIKNTFSDLNILDNLKYIKVSLEQQIK